MTTPTTEVRRRTVRHYLPPQHGAWAMLLVPYLAGLLAAGFRWPDLPLLGAWLAGYLLSYFVLQAVKSRRPGRYRSPISWYASVTAVLALPVVAACPRVLLFAPAYAVLLAVNGWYAYRRRDGNPGRHAVRPVPAIRHRSRPAPPHDRRRVG